MRIGDVELEERGRDANATDSGVPTGIDAVRRRGDECQLSWSQWCSTAGRQRVDRLIVISRNRDGRSARDPAGKPFRLNVDRSREAAMSWMRTSRSSEPLRINGIRGGVISIVKGARSVTASA